MEGGNLGSILPDFGIGILPRPGDPADIGLEADALRQQMLDRPRSVGQRRILEVVVVPGELEALLGERGCVAAKLRTDRLAEFNSACSGLFAGLATTVSPVKELA